MTVAPIETGSARAEIIAAAAQAFAEHGYHGVSMRDLARCTGRSPATFYSHFESKEELLFSMQRDAFETLMAVTQAALSGSKEPVESLYAFVLTHVRYFAEQPALMRVLIHEASALPAKRREVIRQKKFEYFNMARGIVAAIVAADAPGASPGPIDADELDGRTYSAFGMLNWTYTWYEPATHGPPEKLARTIHRVLMHGLRAADPYAALYEKLEQRIAGVDAALASEPRQGGRSP